MKTTCLSFFFQIKPEIKPPTDIFVKKKQMKLFSTIVQKISSQIWIYLQYKITRFLINFFFCCLCKLFYRKKIEKYIRDIFNKARSCIDYLL